ncbi:hypothetical protein Sjap_012258 [Stephania japonica]|uniref:Transmembrane protein n=1 Tax=Stephania japonica TaxID=461633 RepID=A0AAP0IY35_9MAGN
MATLSASSSISTTFISGFQTSKPKIPTISVSNSCKRVLQSALLSFRYGCDGKAQLREQRAFKVFAKSTKGDVNGENEGSDGGQGPPLLTILAGFLVFFFILWVIVSIVMWLVGLIVNVPPLK